MTAITSDPDAPTPAPTPTPTDDSAGRLSPLERFFLIFTEVRAGEGRTIALMFANVLLILCAYYFIKPLREGWLAVSGIEGLTKMEVKAYSSFAQAILLIVVVSHYSKLVARWPREILIPRAIVFCMAVMVLFWLLQPNFFIGTLPYSGVVFYLWVGMFGVFVIAQFWAFAADLFNQERGNRLLPVIAIGATCGAVVGSFIAERLVTWEIVGTEYLLLAALVPLAGAMWLTGAAHRAETDRQADAAPPVEPPSRPPAPALAEKGESSRRTSGAVRMVLGTRLLLAMAVITLLANWVNTNGENLLFRVIQEALEADVVRAGLVDAGAKLAFIRDGTTAFYGNFFFWVNIVALGLQALVASRLLKYGGFGAVFLLLPVIALVSYSVMALIPVLWAIKMMKVAENSTDYSINNTARHVFWLPLSAKAKYKGKPTIDSLFVRFGDGMAALTVLVGVQLLSLSTKTYFILNVGLVVVWIALSVWVVRAHRNAGPDTVPLAE